MSIDRLVGLETYLTHPSRVIDAQSRFPGSPAVAALAPVLSAMRDAYRAPARREEIASVLGLGRDSEGEQG